ncbi:hypothetical protein B0H16DRAFT_352671 [Mycena metata]|uniref:ABC transporter domain-containing protein n=1 Tax=Mycena metata TaxID=1033252 RepID=A0AAD7JP42_9AGAR|nr:hypothetical protein B0H16DRAFT_352671 [Mycena metata]
MILECDSLADGDHRRLREGNSCECKEGWVGINCNVCQMNQACAGFPLARSPVVNTDELNPDDMRCYTGGETVFSNHQMCNVTNRKIIDVVGAHHPVQVTFSCDASTETCAFQFWVEEVESFYCALETCSTAVEPDTNTTTYACDHMKCSCVPGRFICGENGSVDITDFLQEEIRGPAALSCKPGAGCKFEEPAMNDLISDIFGDPYITLDCFSGECLHFSQVPGYVRPPKFDTSKWVALSAAGASLLVLITVAIWYTGGESGQIRLPDDEQDARLMTAHVPATLHFSDLSYTLGARVLLDSISGTVKPGQLCAVMGDAATFLDVLALRSKRGQIGGTTYVNGREVKGDEFAAVTGFVNEGDTLMSTSTVYETVLYSALLRLPREMSLEAKKFRTLETLDELGILGIKDLRVGAGGQHSISGGEKRRVSIACELVTSPSILFLDEPTSGLDAYNAFNVVECLVSLARDYNRTVIFTIHQPRSNIVALFDQLILLASGKLVYSGEFSKCQAYFAGIGQPCPPGFNIADFLIDMTMHASLDERLNTEDTPAPELASPSEALGDEERGLAPHETPMRMPFSGTTHYIRRTVSQLREVVSFSSSSNQQNGNAPIPPALTALVEAYAASAVARGIREEGDVLRLAGANATAENANASGELAVETSLVRGASHWTQFRILSGRTFKDLYRDPALLLAHYVSSIALALICGLLFHDVSDISNLKNRRELFFFTLALLGLSCLSSLGRFANERILFIRERANRYYSTFPYATSKVLFAILPLRVVPALIFGGIVYGLVGLVPTLVSFWKFMPILVLLNLTTAVVVLFLSIATASRSVARLAATLILWAVSIWFYLSYFDECRGED